MAEPVPSQETQSRSTLRLVDLNTQAVLVSFLTGGFGVLSGYAVFFLCLEEANRPRLFATALLIAAMLSTAYEWLRERIEAHGRGWSWSRVFTTMVMLAMAEFFVMAFHGTVMFEDLPPIARATMGEGVTRAEIADTEAEVTRPGTESPGAGSEVTHSGTGLFAAGAHSGGVVGWWRTWGDLIVLAMLWIFVGGIVAIALAWGIRPQASGHIRQSVQAGGAVAAIAAPLGLLTYALGVALLKGVVLLFHPTAWNQHVANARDHAEDYSQYGGSIFAFLFRTMESLLTLFGDHWWAPPLVLFGFLLLAAWCANKNRVPALAVLIVAAVVFLLVAPLLLYIGELALLMGRAALIWLAPGVVLGFMVPFLRRPAAEEHLWVWPLVAFLGAAIVLVVTLLRFENRWWLLLLAGLLAATGFVVRRGAKLEQIWSQMALAVAVLAAGLTAVVQEVATFAGVYQALHVLTALPSQLAPRPPVTEISPEWLSNRQHWQELMSLMSLQSQLLRTVPLGEDLLSPDQRKSLSPDQRKSLARDRLANLDARAKLHPELSRQLNDELALSEKKRNHLQVELDHLRKEPFHHQLKEIIKLQQQAAAEEERRAPLRKIVADWVSQIQALNEISTRIVRTGPQAQELVHESVNPPTAESIRRRNEQEQLNRDLEPLNAEIRARQSMLLDDLPKQQKGFEQSDAKLDLLKQELDELERSLQATAVRWLELALAGSLGFWVTLGLMARWSSLPGAPSAADATPSADHPSH